MKKKRQQQETIMKLKCSSVKVNLYLTFFSHVSKVMLKILQARLQQYMYWELPDVEAGLIKSRGTKDQIANIHSITEKTSKLKKKKTRLLHWLC